MPVPTYDGLFNPLLRAIRERGGSASVAEQEDKVAQLLNLSDQEASEIHRGNRTKLSYRLAWARNYLKRVGLLENSARGVWALTAPFDESFRCAFSLFRQVSCCLRCHLLANPVEVVLSSPRIQEGSSA